LRSGPFGEKELEKKKQDFAMNEKQSRGKIR